jgi:hypothetical protein
VVNEYVTFSNFVVTTGGKISTLQHGVAYFWQIPIVLDQLHVVSQNVSCVIQISLYGLSTRIAYENEIVKYMGSKTLTN